ncbi:HIT family protein [Pelistega ratti]|uniref:HIT family protein n=1 Tax=Pelistega ratti TaxID=2652177 RepID=UPI0013581B83|nr:HIT family protein [Pelistega ratti]
MSDHCILCQTVGGKLIYQNDFIRIINAQEPHYPAFTRVILQQHQVEMTDLPHQDRQRLMDYVYLVEQVQRDILQPYKINLAQFGTMVPHIHWHIIPRYQEDLHYPASIWSQSDKDMNASDYLTFLEKQHTFLETYHQTLQERLHQFDSKTTK